MNYSKIYEDLIRRAINRNVNGYTEKHHVIPRCLGGDDSRENLVELTPEEHYLAHQLLVRMYPNDHRLVRAAQMMVVNRPSNKLYGWLRRKFALAQSERQAGKGNSQYGTRWIHNLDLKKSKKISQDSPLPFGWLEGRRIGNWSTTRFCKNCNKEFEFKSLENYCSDKCKKESLDPFVGREKEFLLLYQNVGSMNKALKEMGFPGAVSHYYRWAKKVLTESSSAG